MLRTPANRKRLVAATFTAVAIYGLGNFFEQPVIALAGIVAYFGPLFVMRAASRMIPDRPGDIVDGRMREVRGGSTGTATSARSVS